MSRNIAIQTCVRVLHLDTAQAFSVRSSMAYAAIHQGDAVRWLETLPDGSVDLVVTDPPYESLEKHRCVGTTTRLKHSKASSNDWFEIFPNCRFAELFAELYRVLRKNTHLYMFCDQETMFVAKPLGEAAGFRFWKPLVWDKMKIGMGYHYRARYELVLFFEKGKRKLNNLGTPDIIEVPRVYRGYPTEKPVAVSEILIHQSTQPGEVVVDPFMGAPSSRHPSPRSRARRFTPSSSACGPSPRRRPASSLRRRRLSKRPSAPRRQRPTSACPPSSAPRKRQTSAPSGKRWPPSSPSNRSPRTRRCAALSRLRRPSSPPSSRLSSAPPRRRRRSRSKRASSSPRRRAKRLTSTRPRPAGSSTSSSATRAGRRTAKRSPSGAASNPSRAETSPLPSGPPRPAPPTTCCSSASAPSRWSRPSAR